MKALTSLLAIFALLTPGHVFGFARALDQANATGTIFVVARVGETITLTAFAGESNKRWLVLSPPDATFMAVPRLLFLPFEMKTRPVLQGFSHIEPCAAAKAIEDGDADPDEKYFSFASPGYLYPPSPLIRTELDNVTPFDLEKHPTHLSADLNSYLDEGWVLREVELGITGQGVQFSFNADRFEIPPRPASGVAHRGELTLISIAEARMEPVNFKNQIPPTNIEIKRDEEMSNNPDLDRLLAAVFAEVDKNENSAFITEFALDLPSNDFKVHMDMFSSKELPEELTVTRLRKFGDLGTFSSPIQLFPAFKMAGGDNIESNGKLRAGGYSADRNDFRTRLVYRTMPRPDRALPCENPVWNTWFDSDTRRLRARFDRRSTDEVRKELFQTWLLTDVPEIYWSPETEPPPVSSEPEAPATPSQVGSQCGGCASTESSATLALLFALFFTRRRTR